MNLLRGPIERISVPTKAATTWDEGLMTSFFREQRDIDTIEYNSVKRVFLLTRNPPYFESTFNSKGERIAVKYNKEFEQEPDIKKWTATWKSKFETKFPGIEIISEEKMIVDQLECLPTDFEQFVNTFVDGLNIKNALLFQRRIQGLVSYYKGADERMLPKRLDEDKTLQKIPMSDEQFLRYLESRHEEIEKEKRQVRMKSELDSDFGSFRMGSRLVCNYAVPRELRVLLNEETDEETNVPKTEVLEKIKQSPEQYLSPKALEKYSPKMGAILKDLLDSHHFSQLFLQNHFDNF
jgi:hypothetical protein